jgi:hypothetical protein
MALLQSLITGSPGPRRVCSGLAVASSIDLHWYRDVPVYRSLCAPGPGPFGIGPPSRRSLVQRFNADERLLLEEKGRMLIPTGTREANLLAQQTET